MRIYKRTWKEKDGTVREAETFSMRCYDPWGTRRRVALNMKTRKGADRRAREILRQWEQDHEAGLPGPRGVDAAEDMRALLDRYLADLVRLKRGTVYVNNQENRIWSFLRHVQALSELTPELIGILSARIQKEGKGRKGRPLSEKTTLYYLRSLGAFFRWLTEQRVWRLGNPVDAVRKPTVAGNETRERGSLTVEQLRALVDAAPIHRGAVYLLAATTGLRRGELRKLLERDVDLEAGVVEVRWQTSKNKRGARIPIAPWAIAYLRRYLGEVPPGKQCAARARPRGERMFGSVPTTPTFYADLKSAGIPQDPHAWLDFHSLRVTFATLLARSGVPLQHAQRLMRHSDPKLTASIYTRLTLEDDREAAHRLSGLLGGPESAPARKAPSARPRSA